VYEVGIKEMWSVLLSASYYFASFFFGKYSVHCITPKDIKDTTKIIIFLHGKGGGSFCFFPLANKLHQAGFQNLYAIDYKRTKTNPVPVELLDKTIKDLSQKCFDRGSKKVDITLIGHSLGAIIASKYIWKTKPSLDKRIKISNVISCAGVLRFVRNRFSWFCKYMVNELPGLYKAYQKSPARANLYTIGGSLDELIPKDAIHIQRNPTREFTIQNIGHGGIINSNKAHLLIIQLLKPWLAKE